MSVSVFQCRAAWFPQWQTVAKGTHPQRALIYWCRGVAGRVRGGWLNCLQLCSLILVFCWGNRASFVSAWLFLWRTSEVTNGTRWLLAAKWDCEYQKNWSKPLLATLFKNYALLKLTFCTVCLQGIWHLQALFYFFLLLTGFFYCFLVHKTLFRSAYAHWQIASSHKPIFKVDALPIFRDNERQFFFILIWVQKFKLGKAGCSK